MRTTPDTVITMPAMHSAQLVELNAIGLGYRLANAKVTECVPVTRAIDDVDMNLVVAFARKHGFAFRVEFCK